MSTNVEMQKIMDDAKEKKSSFIAINLWWHNYNKEYY